MIQSRNIFLILLYTCTSTSKIIMSKSFAGSRHLRPQFLHWTGSRRAPRQREEGSVTLPFPRTPAKSRLKQPCFGPKSIQIYEHHSKLSGRFQGNASPSLFSLCSPPLWVACSHSRQRVGAAASQRPPCRETSGQAVVAGTLQGPSPASADHHHPPTCHWGVALAPFIT